MLPDASYIEDIKSFPMNTEVRTVKTYDTQGNLLPSGRYTVKVTLGLNISFVLLPEKPMMRRYYDPRVGFFTDRFDHCIANAHPGDAALGIHCGNRRLQARPYD